MSSGIPGFDGNGREDFIVGCVYGARFFQVEESLNGLRLHGACAYWDPGENAAVCLRGYDPHRAEAVPAEDLRCGCGFWAYWQAGEAPWGTTLLDVLAVVRGYGRTLTGDLGFRCEKAKIMGVQVRVTPYPGAGSVILPDVQAIRRQIAARYEVPVYDTEAELLARHPLTTEYLPPMDAAGKPKWRTPAPARFAAGGVVAGGGGSGSGGGGASSWSCGCSLCRSGGGSGGGTYMSSRFRAFRQDD